MHANTKLIKYVNNNLILMYLSITCKLGIITFVLFFYFNKILFTYLNIINIMIFNSIEKELINYSNSPNKLS
jgi:hypothetical protein